MPPIRIDLFSDTHSRPTAPMRRAMAAAEVGDEQQGADPTTRAFEARAARLLGKEAALFLPSGTMCNAIAVRLWCRQGDEVLLDRTAHPIHFESGGPAALSGAMLRPLDGDRGLFTADQVRAGIRPTDRHAPRSRLLSVENTANLGGGRVWPLAQIREVCAAAREAGLACHMDGARLFNAVVASGTPAADYAAPFDTCWFDLSKGLGCPMGAVLAGSAEVIAEAARLKQQFGGALRQSGIVTAAGLYALDHHVDRLAEDHANARRFAASIGGIDGVTVVNREVETNIVFFDVTARGLTGQALSEALLARGIYIGGNAGNGVLRAVTHLDVTAEMVDEAAEGVRQALEQL